MIKWWNKLLISNSTSQDLLKYLDKIKQIATHPDNFERIKMMEEELIRRQKEGRCPECGQKGEK